MARGRKKKTNNAVVGANGKVYDYHRIVRKIGDKQKTFRGKTREEAEEKYQAAVKQYEESQLLGEKISFGDWADAWIESAWWASDYAERTKATYINAWNQYVKSADIYSRKITDITSLDIQNLYNTIDAPPSTVKKCHNLMTHFCAFLAVEGVCPNLAANVTPPKIVNREDEEDRPYIVETWSDDELRKILGSFDRAPAGFRYKALILLAAFTGARVSELLALRLSDIYRLEETDEWYVKIRRQIVPVKRGEDKTVMTVGPLKSKRAKRDIPLFGHIVYDVTAEQMGTFTGPESKKYGWDNPHKYLFLTQTGHFVDRSNLRRALETYYNAIGVTPRSIHTYRRTFGTMCYRQGVDIEVCARLMGHASTATTSKYYVDISHSDTVNALKPAMQQLLQLV